MGWAGVALSSSVNLSILRRPFGLLGGTCIGNEEAAS